MLIILLLLFYVLPVYLVFFRFRLIELTRFWKVVTAVPSVADSCSCGSRSVAIRRRRRTPMCRPRSFRSRRKSAGS